MRRIEPVIGNKKEYLHLLLDADPSETMIDRYLEDGEMYLLTEDGFAASVAVALPLDTQKALRGKGCATELVEFLCRRYTGTFSAMVVGTSDYGRAFYERMGFKFSHIAEHFFTRHYPEPLYDEDGSVCDHMTYLRRELKWDDAPALPESLRYEILEYGSLPYRSSLDLRARLMRSPLGLDLFKDDLSREGDYIHFAALDSGGKVWGVVVADPKGDGTVDIRAAAVDPNLQRCGCGRKLMEMMESYFRDRKAHEVILHSRKTAVGFYERLGYARDGGEFLEVTIPHYQVRKRL